MDFDELFGLLCKRLTASNKVQEVSKQFLETTTDEGRIAIAYQHLSSLDMLPRITDNGRKSAKKSTELRESGNKKFGKANDAALRLYTESIATAPWVNIGAGNVGEELALAFANRSAVFYAMDNYESCLDDIEQALALNYPEKLKYKVLERKGKCLQRLGRLVEAKQSFQEALACSVPEEKASLIRATLKQLAKEVNLTPEPHRTSGLKDDPLPTRSYGENREVPCASDALRVKYSPELGRFIEAARDIETGDVLLVEVPYAAVLLPQHYLTHCYHCLRRYSALIPCRSCALTMYCSEECRSISWQQSHCTECPILPTLNLLDMGKISPLALRIIIKSSQNGSGFPSLLSDIQALEERSQDPRIRGFTKEKIYESSNYISIHSLVGNTESRTVGDLFKRASKSACILSCLERGTDLLKDADEYRMFVGGLLMRLLQSLPCNAHSVTDQVGTAVTTSADIGGAAYATLSLLNHSCDPNVTRSHHRGDVAVLRAIRPIKTGEQILDNYGLHYALQNREERQAELQKQYYFTCQCEGCVKDWPTYLELSDTNPGFICTNCRSVLCVTTPTIVTCGKCKHVNNIAEVIVKLDKIVKSFNTIYVSLLSGGGHDYVSELAAHLTFLDGAVLRPWRLYNDCQEALKECFARSGNFYRQ